MSEQFKFENATNVVILGANRGIGLAFCQELSIKYPNVKIYAVYRKQSSPVELEKLQNIKPVALDIFNENEITKFFSQLDSVDLFINTVGILHSETIQPEKSLRDFNIEQSLEVFRVNTLLTPLWAKHIKSKLSKIHPSLFLCLSAKVGSIEDNKIGGWYSYRASKTALNMMMKNISIEFERSKLATIVIAAHPGTTITGLSKPFIANTQYKLWQPIETAGNIIKAIEQQKVHETGIFLDWKGGYLPW